MTNESNTENLGHEQAHAVLRFLLARMNTDTRITLMAEMPVAYARLYPNVSATRITETVGHVIEGIRA